MDTEEKFLGGLATLLILLSLFMVTPFLSYVVAAVLMAFVMRPLQRRIEPRIGSGLTAALLIVVFIAAILAPFGIALNAVVGDAREVISDIGQADMPGFDEIESFILEYTGQEISLEQELQQGLQNLVEGAAIGFAQAIDVITGFAIGFMIFLFIFFYLLKDGDRLYKWLREVTPVSDNIQDDLYFKARLMTRSVLKGHVLVAIVVGLIGGIGLWIAGIPNVAFWTFLMIIFSFIPVIGAFIVWLPASIYLFLSGDSFWGMFLFLYGAVIVSLSDNLLRPYLVDSRAEIHPAAIMIGVIGGIYVFGAVGLFIGPVIFGFTKTVLDVFMRNYPHE